MFFIASLVFLLTFVGFLKTYIHIIPYFHREISKYVCIWRIPRMIWFTTLYIISWKLSIEHYFDLTTNKVMHFLDLLLNGQKAHTTTGTCIVIVSCRVEYWLKANQLHLYMANKFYSRLSPDCPGVVVFGVVILITLFQFVFRLNRNRYYLFSFRNGEPCRRKQ